MTAGRRRNSLEEGRGRLSDLIPPVAQWLIPFRGRAAGSLALTHACQPSDPAICPPTRSSASTSGEAHTRIANFTEVARPVSLAEYVEAFYTTAVFRLERVLLAWLVARPSSDMQARQLACGHLAPFAAWSVEAREADQMLLCDFRGRTRSWLMTAPAANSHSTRLFFGSAVVPVVSRRSGKARMSFAFRALLGFHKLYSRVLLRAAANRLARRVGSQR